MDFQPLRIAVTGGSGKVGRAVIRYLVGRGHSVINIDQKSHRDSPARFVYLDLRRRELLQPVLEQVDAVIHLGEIPHAGFFSDDYTFSHNTAAGSTVLTTAADLKLRHVVYTSTCQVYGAWGNPVVPPLRLPVDETHPLQPTNSYSLSKVANENYAQFIAAQYGLRVTIFRLPWVLTDRHAERMLQWMGSDPSGAVERDGLGTYLHASDIGPAYEAALLLNREGCHTYNLAASDVLMWQSVHDQLEQFHPNWPKLPADWGKRRGVLSAEKARAELGWTPQWDLVATFERVTGKPWPSR